MQDLEQQFSWYSTDRYCYIWIHTISMQHILLGKYLAKETKSMTGPLNEVVLKENHTKSK